MNIVNVNPFIDCAGVGFKLSDALNRLTPHKCKHIVGVTSYLEFDYEKFLAETSIEEIEEILNSADILHFSHYDWKTIVRDSERNLSFDFSKIIKGKKLVYHNHGGHLEGREFYDEYKAGLLFDKYTGIAPVVACSPTYESVYRGCRFMPNVIPQNHPRYSPQKREWDGLINICHTPSTTLYKGTRVVDEVIGSLIEDGYNIRYIRTIGLPHEKVMRFKRDSHIMIDSMYDSHPNMSGLEGLSCGLATITKMVPEAKNTFQKFGGDFPMIGVENPADLKATLVKLLNDRSLLEQTAMDSRKWIEEFYSDKIITQRWVEFYEQL